jgi:ribosomal protein S18 acetylase RimI-like enzyme
MIRQAQIEDYEPIKKIKHSVGIDRSKLDNREYRVSLQKGGFLLFANLEKRDFEKDLRKIFLVYEQEGEIIGYVRIDTEPEVEKDGDPIWFQQDLEPVYLSYPHANIGGIAVSPATKQKGIGTALLQEAIKRIKQREMVSYLFSAVVFSPITNLPSILFHEKSGFDRVAFVNFQNLYNLENYQCVLYGKKM